MKAAELGQVTGVEGSARHVEVFRMAGVGTSIFERPRPLSDHRRADVSATTRYTPVCEEPDLNVRPLDPQVVGLGLIARLTWGFLFQERDLRVTFCRVCRLLVT